VGVERAPLLVPLRARSVQPLIDANGTHVLVDRSHASFNILALGSKDCLRYQWKQREQGAAFGLLDTAGPFSSPLTAQ
jgi:hypothetical protein